MYRDKNKIPRQKSDIMGQLLYNCIFYFTEMFWHSFAHVSAKFITFLLPLYGQTACEIARTSHFKLMKNELV